MLNNSRMRKSEASSPEGEIRKKLHSLRLLNPRHLSMEYTRGNDQQVFRKLEKSLQKDNRQEQPISDPTPLLPDDQNNKIEDSFWKMFVGQAQKATGKVERQRVNFYQKLFLQLKKDYKGQNQTRNKSIEGLQASIRQKYRQVHCLFQEIKQQRAVTIFNTSATKTRKSKKSQALLLMDNSSKVNTLKQTIQQLRKQVAQIQKQMQLIINEQRQSNQSWLYLIKKMLLQGYYLKKGAIPLLQQMVGLKYFPRLSDMPKCLDEVSKRCLLVQSEKIKSSKTAEMPKRVYSQSNSKMAVIAKKDLIRDIYKETKQYMINLVKESGWKQAFTLPPLKKFTKPSLTDWRQNQKNRLSHVYTGQQYTKARSILFGPKVQTKI